MNRRRAIVGVAATLGGLAAKPFEALPPQEEITHWSVVIHQQVEFGASPKRVYDTLTDAAKFGKVPQDH
jgi:hypothetical protein